MATVYTNAVDYITTKLLNEAESTIIKDYVRCLHNESIGKTLDKDRFVVRNSEVHFKRLIDESGLPDNEKEKVQNYIDAWIRREKIERMEMYKNLSYTEHSSKPKAFSIEERIQRIFKDDNITPNIHPEDPAIQNRFNRIAVVLNIDIEMVKGEQRKRFNPSNNIAI